jgi:carbamoyl-phosphate synthase large subunit
VLYNAGIKCNAIFRISRGRPNLLDMMNEKSVQWIINTPETGAESKVDEIQMRAQAVSHGIPITTTLDGMSAAIEGMKALRDMGGRMEICSLQEYHRHVKKNKILS